MGDYESRMQLMDELPDDYHGKTSDRMDDHNGEHDSVKNNLFGTNIDNIDRHNALRGNHSTLHT
jgi:hypothetical protein